MAENRLQRPSGFYVCPVFSSRTCVHARHVILMVLHVLYQVTVRNCSCLLFFLFLNFFLNFHFSLKLFLICSYFLGDLSLTVFIKCVLNIKKSVHVHSSSYAENNSYDMILPSSSIIQMNPRDIFHLSPCLELLIIYGI